MKNMVSLALFLSISWGLLPAWAFEFAHPSEGDVVIAGSTLKILMDPGEVDPLFGALLMVSRGIAQPKIDSMPPFKWEIEIPSNYYGPLTLWAIGRRYSPIANPPRASVRIFVVYPVLPLMGQFPSVGSFATMVSSP